MKKMPNADFDIDLFLRLLSDTARIKRQEMNLTQGELISLLKARGIKVSQAYLSQLEAGQRKDPSARIVIALSAVLGIELDHIIKEASRNDG